MLDRTRFIAMTALVLAALPGAQGVRAQDRPIVGPSDPLANLQIDSDRVIARIDERKYGHFLEHIYHSVNGGLWGEKVLNRSFQETQAEGPVRLTQGRALIAPGGAFAIGDVTLKNYLGSFRLRRSAGQGPVRIAFCKGRYAQYYVDLGAQSIALEVVLGAWFDQNPAPTVIKTLERPIDLDHWRRIEISCGSGGATFGIDGEVLFKPEVPRGPSDGGFVISASSGSFEVADIQAKHQDGSPLLNAPSLSRHWSVVGSPSLNLDRDRPLNDTIALNIVGGKGDGVAQDRLVVRANDPLSGRIFLRGEAAGGVEIRLSADGQTIARQIIPGLTDAWKPYRLDLTPTRSSHQASLAILARGRADLTVDQVELMPRSAARNDGFDPALFKAVDALHPPVLRWPGGSFIYGYDWKRGIGDQATRVGHAAWDDYDPYSVGVDEFMRLCEKLGAKPVMVVPIGPQTAKDGLAIDRTSYLQSALDLMEYLTGPPTSTWGAMRARNGHPAPYEVGLWEIDNEPWQMTPQAYAEVVRVFAPALRNKAEALGYSIKLIAAGGGDQGDQWGDADDYLIANIADQIDFLSIHQYWKPESFDVGPDKSMVYWGKLAQAIARSKNPRLELFLSEWNASSTDWRTGLYAGGLLNALEQSPIVTMATPALLLRHTSAPAWDNAFINFDNRGWFPAPNYVVTRLFRDHFQPNLIATRNVPKGISINATKSDDGRTLILKVVNLSDQRQKLAAQVNGTFRVGQAAGSVVSGAALASRNSMEHPDTIASKAAAVEVDDNVVSVDMPKWSVWVIELKAPARP